MAAKLPPKDVVIIGLGWTGSILAHELTEPGLDVVAIERGPWRDTAPDFSPALMQDELRFRIRHEFFLRPAQTSFTFRNNAEPNGAAGRTWGAFMLGNGAGGRGVHWNAETWRFLPSDFVKSPSYKRYGAEFLPHDMTIQDWGVTYDELEPHYDRFEYLCGTSGTAGNLNGNIQEGGNPFEGPRSRPYPDAGRRNSPIATLSFAEAAHDLGYKPFPQPSGNLSQAYINPLGVSSGLALIAAFANGLAAAIIPKPARRLRFCRFSCANRISRRAANARSRA